MATNVLAVRIHKNNSNWKQKTKPTQDTVAVSHATRKAEITPSLDKEFLLTSLVLWVYTKQKTQI